MLNISPSALKAYLRCKREWYLSYVLRAPKVVPAYVTAGSALDLAVQRYLADGSEPHGADGPDEVRAELAVTRAELPHPGTVLVQYQPPRAPVPGLEGLAQITTGGLDYCTPPNADLMVIGDLKRVWHRDAAMTPTQLLDNEQANMYAWLIYQAHAPRELVLRWTYCVRGTASGTRKPQAFSVDAKAERGAVDAWIERILLPAAHGMLELNEREGYDLPRAAKDVEHDPDSCEEGARCFVRSSCPLHEGPVKGAIHVDLSRFKTSAQQAAAKGQDVVAAFQATSAPAAPRIAINPPAIVPAPEPLPDVSRIVESPAESDAAALEWASAPAADTEPAPAPAPAEDKPTRRRRAKAAAAEPDTEAADVTVAALLHELAEARKAISSMMTLIAELEAAALDKASTEAIVSELADRGWRCWLEQRS